jgi:NTE family protein
MLCAFLACAGCSTAPVTNAPLLQSALQPRGQPISRDGYRITSLPEAGDPQVLVLLAFSGGGKRSSAFGYGVLRGLRDATVATESGMHRLLDQVDFISAVSGGSFPAAYYGLYGDGIFANFERDFLRQDIESYVWGTFLLPWHLGWLFESDRGTNDRMAEVYDDLMFHHATYADLARRKGPFIALDATDVNFGSVFQFTQDQFDLICSDLSPFPLARAVAASNGFPVLFTPITLRSYAERCGGRVPPWLASATESDPLSRRRVISESAKLYLDPERTRYVHLLDGGISDNLAMRGMINMMIMLSAQGDLMSRPRLKHVRRILLISADGQATADTSTALSPAISSLHQIIGAVSGTHIDAYNFETMVLARDQIRKFAEAIARDRCDMAPVVDGHACGDVQARLVHLSLADVADTAIRQRLQRIATGLTLEDKDIDDLIAAGESAVKDSRDIQALRSDLLKTVATAEGIH